MPYSESYGLSDCGWFGQKFRCALIEDGDAAAELMYLAITRQDHTGLNLIAISSSEMKFTGISHPRAHPRQIAGNDGWTQLLVYFE